MRDDLEQDDNEREQHIKESLFGAVRKARATGGHVADRQRLLEPLEGPGSVIHSFCKGCGYYLEYPQEGAEILAKSAGFKLPSSLEGFYFETGSCSLCDGEDKSLWLKRIQGKKYCSFSLYRDYFSGTP